MIADSTEIKFQCSQCGQSISVDSSGAGLSANCPTCDNPLVVPSLSSLHHRQYGESTEAAPDRAAYAGEDTDFSADEAQALREELIEAQRRADEAEEALAAARKDAARLQQQLRQALEDGERHAASAHSGQGDVEALQAEREQWKGELAESRRGAALTESQLEDARRKIAELAAEIEAADDIRAQWETAFTQAAEQHAQALATAQGEAEALQAESVNLRTQIESVQTELRDAAGSGAALAEKLAETKRALESAEKEGLSLSLRCADLSKAEEILRRDLSEIHTGRELLALRERFTTLETNHERASAALGRRESEVQTLSASVQSLRAELTETSGRAAAAERRAEAASESQLCNDNEVLRGIIARQNAEGEERFAELRRLQKARLMLRLVYGLIALAVLGLLALGFHILPDAVQQVLSEWFGF